MPLAANVIEQLTLYLRGELEQFGAQEVRAAERADVDALANEIQSYKQLPARVYWYDRGMTRLTVCALEATADAAREAYATLDKLGSDFMSYARVAPSRADDLDEASVWYTTAPSGQLDVFKSTTGKYAAARAVAQPHIEPAAQEALLPLEQVETPHCDTIDALARFLNVPTARTAKAVFFSTGDRVIFAVIRGDLQIDEDKVKRLTGASVLRRATDDEIRRVGATPGYASPVGVRDAVIVVDRSALDSPNLAAGANKEGYHLLNTNVPRDYAPNVSGDIALARPGDPSPDGGSLELVSACALGATFAPRQLASSFLDQNGKPQKPYCVLLELDLSGVLFAHLGANHDDKGIVWSRALAPYDVHVVALNADKPEVAAALSQATDTLELAGLNVLLDDRSESAGVKFNDADLLGLPLRVTIGPKTVAQNSVELKKRNESTAQLVLLADLAKLLEAM